MKIQLICVLLSLFIFISNHPIKWDNLKEYNLEKKMATEGLKKLLNESNLKIAGFMVPLDYEKDKIKEFLLIPNPMSCLHVPPPEQNQMILVKMKPKKAANYYWGPINVEGKITLSQKNDGQSPVFEMLGDNVSEYKSTTGEHLGTTPAPVAEGDKKK